MLDSTVETVQDVSRDARAGLVRQLPALADDAALAARLDAAVPSDVRSVRRFDDLRHGQDVVRRRWLRRAGLLAASVVVLVLVVSQLRPADPSPVSGPAPAPVTSTVTVTPSPTTPCDRAQPTCQGSLTRAWRATVFEVVADYLDPSGAYLNASSWYARDETDDLWSTKRGALAMEVFRVGGGSTQIYVQVATDRSFAPRCGQATSTTCSSLRSMDGNRYTLNNATNAAGGLEGQYRPDGNDVITVIVQDNGRGPALPVTSGQVVAMLQDSRLRMPAL